MYNYCFIVFSQPTETPVIASRTKTTRRVLDATISQLKTPAIVVSNENSEQDMVVEVSAVFIGTCYNLQASPVESDEHLLSAKTKVGGRRQAKHVSETVTATSSESSEWEMPPPRRATRAAAMTSAQRKPLSRRNK